MKTKAVTCDHETLNGLRALQNEGETDFIQGVIRTFIGVFVEKSALIHSSVARGEIDSLKRNAHTLKSSCNMVGAFRLGELCQELETAGLEEARLILVEFEGELQLFRDALKELGLG